jgi:hypothetical protein
MEVQGFVSKKERLEKMHRPWLPAIWYFNTVNGRRQPDPHLFVTLSPPAAVYTGQQHRPEGLGSLVEPEGKVTKQH